VTGDGVYGAAYLWLQYPVSRKGDHTVAFSTEVFMNVTLAVADFFRFLKLFSSNAPQGKRRSSYQKQQTADT
jgi:hypothetical protein